MGCRRMQKCSILVIVNLSGSNFEDLLSMHTNLHGQMLIILSVHLSFLSKCPQGSLWKILEIFLKDIYYFTNPFNGMLTCALKNKLVNYILIMTYFCHEIRSGNRKGITIKIDAECIT